MDEVKHKCTTCKTETHIPTRICAACDELNENDLRLVITRKDGELIASEKRYMEIKDRLILSFQETKKLKEYITKLEDSLDSIFDKIAHGDDAHREWLKKEMDTIIASIKQKREKANE